jgi:anti-sigma factor RsiW
VIETNQEMACQLEDVAAYVDGELTGAALEDFEFHLRSCGACADELRTQKQLLCTLDVAVNDSRSFELPREFSRVVTARAESDLSGMRRKHERRRALKLCAALALTSFALMGAAARGLVIDPLRSIFRVANILLDFASRAALDLAETLAVFIRVFARAIFSAPHGIGVLFLIALLLSILLLPFLIARYHRAQIIE